MTFDRATIASAVLVTATVATTAWLVVPGSHLPTGDGAHLLAASWRIAASGAPLDDLLHRITPHPPLAYVPGALTIGWLGVRGTLAAQALCAGAAAFIGLRWLRPGVHPAAHLVSLTLLGTSGVVWWAVDQHALDWLSAALTLLALGAVVRASTETSPGGRAGAAAALCLLGALFTKYTAAFPLAGGVAAALVLGAWRQRATWIAAAIVGGFGLAWAGWALDDLAAYGTTTMQESGAGGPAGAINRDPSISLGERLSPARLGLWASALRDTLGLGPWLVLAGTGLWTGLRARGAYVALAAGLLPLLVFPLMRIQPQPRYLLPTAALLLAAGLPERSRRRAPHTVGALALVAIISLVYSAALYQGSPVADRPGHRAATPTAGWGDWPWPARPTWPTRSPVEQWGTAQALAALDHHLHEGETAALVRFGFDPDRPSWAAVDLVARTQGIDREWVVAESPRGPLQTPPGMVEPTLAWVCWTDEAAAPALAWVQDHADIEGALTWWSANGTGGVVLPLGAHHH